MAALSLVFDLIGRDVSASKAFKNVGDEADRAGKKGGAAGNAIAGGMKLAAGALIGGGLIAGFKSLYDAAAESAKIGALTGQVIKSTGGAAGISAKQVGDLAGAIAKKTGVDDEAIQSGENLLLTFTNVKNVAGEGNDIFSQATKIMTDMSVALGTDASGSAIQLGKALNDPIKGVSALQRVGVSFTAAQKDQIRTLVESGKTMDAQKIILGELSKEFGGAAEAAATPFGKLQQRLGDLAETLGAELIPYVDRFATFMMDEVLPAVTDVGGAVAGTLGPALGLAVDTFKGLFEAVAGAVGLFADLPGPIQAGAVALGLIVALKNPVSSMFETVALKALYMGDAIKGSVGSVGGLKAAAGGLVGAMGGPLGLAITGATVGLGFLVDWLGKTDKATEQSKQATQTYTDALRAANGVINESVRQAAAKAAADAGILDVADKVGIALPNVTSAITDQGTALDSTRARLAQYISQHTTMLDANTISLDAEGQAAQGALDALNGMVDGGNKTVATQLQVARATGDATAAANVASPAMQAYASELEDSAQAADDAKKQTDLLKLSLDILTGANVSLIEVQSAYEATLDSAKDAVKDLDGAVLNQKGNLDLSSESGRKASDVLLDIRNSGNQLIATMMEQGATTDEVKAKDAELRASFIRSAEQMGISKGEAKKLADQILGIPAERQTKILADITPAEAALNRLLGKYNGKTLTMSVAARIAGGATVNSLGLAEGGHVPGFSPAHDSDNIPAWLTAGEYVLPRKATDSLRSKFGDGFLEALRTGMPGFAKGGPVSDYMSRMFVRATADTSGGDSAIRGIAQRLANSISIEGPNGGGSATQGPSALVAFGRLLQRMGARVSEHPAFGGVTPGAHVRGSKHYVGKAIDVNTRPGTSALEQRELDPLMAMARRAGFQVIWRQAGHFGHGHVASYKTGTDYVPSDGLAYLHKGERVVPAEQNAALGGPIDLSDATIVKLARAMMQGADGRIVARDYRRGVDARSS